MVRDVQVAEMKPITPHQFDVLFPFLDKFEAPGFSAGEWITEPGFFPCFSSSSDVLHFVQVLYDNEWITPAFDWTEWQESAFRYVQSPQLIDSADAMLQAISYAGMVSQWQADEFLQLLDDDQQESLSEFLDVDCEDINRQQRIILLAEAYDYALLIGTEWLCEQYGVGIVCCRIAVATDSVTKAEYLVCSNVYPAPELAKEAVPRGKKGGVTKVRWSDWETTMSTVTNTAVTSYFAQEIDANRDSYLPKRILRYSVAGKRRWFMAARNKNAYVWQHGRFVGDIDFWRNGLSKPDVVKPVKTDECLRLFLNTSEDFQFFHNAVTKNLQSAEWLGGSLEGELDEVDVPADEESTAVIEGGDVHRMFGTTGNE